MCRVANVQGGKYSLSRYLATLSTSYFDDDLWFGLKREAFVLGIVLAWVALSGQMRAC
jgi:hypothetical protein